MRWQAIDRVVTYFCIPPLAELDRMVSLCAAWCFQTFNPSSDRVV